MKKALLILLCALNFSCNRREIIQTRLYTEDGMEILNGQVKEIFSGDSTSKLKEYQKYDFEENGDMTRSVEKSVDIALNGNEADTTISVDNRKYVVKRDKSGLIKFIKYKGKGYTGEFKFDTKGHLAMDGNPRDSIGEIVYYECDTIGDVLKRTWVHRGQLASSEVYEYKYDGKHLLIEQTSFEGGFRLDKEEFEYKEFDTNHNWIKKICRWHTYPPIRTDSGSYIVTRKISYY